MRKRKPPGELRFHNTYSFKLFLFFSVVMLVTLLGMTFLLTREVSRKLYEQEIKINRNITKKTAEYMESRVESARKTIQDIYFSDKELQKIINSMLNDTIDQKTLAYLSQKERFESLFISALYNDKDIVDIILLGKDQEKAFIFSKKWSTVQMYNRDFPYDWAGEIINSQSALTIIPSHPPLHMPDGPPLVYSAAASIYDAIEHDGVTGIIIINYLTENIPLAYDMYREDLKGDIYVYTDEFGTIYDTTGSQYGKKIDLSRASHGKNTVITTETEGMNLSITAVTPDQALLKDINNLKRQSYLILLLAILIILLFYYKASHHLLRRISQVLNVMKDVEKGNLDARIQIGSMRDELELIAFSFNGLCERLESYIEKSYISEIRLREAELQALQRKINPHFIFNTLEIIRVKALLQENHDVADMILLLSSLFRKSLRTKDMVVSLKDEMEYCRIYLDLNNIRFQERMSVEYDLDPDIMESAVIKMILQPLVENVIVHGVDGSREHILISIKAYREGDDMAILIHDTGKGMDAASLRDVNASLNEGRTVKSNKHLGLRNVNDRLKIVFGESYGLRLYSSPGKGTSVMINMPLMTREEMTDFAG